MRFIDILRSASYTHGRHNRLLMVGDAHATITGKVNERGRVTPMGGIRRFCDTGQMRMGLRVLLVIPEVGLNVDSEIEWITRTYHTESLTGVVTPARIFEYVAGRRFDVVHFGSHGNETGIELSNGTSISMFEVERLARAVGANLLYLNSCSSARLAQFAVDQGIPAVIASTHALDDAVIAWSVAISFYQALLANGDFYQSYEAAKPRDGTLSFFSNGHLVSRQMKPLLDKMAVTEKQLKTLHYTQLFLAIVVFGELIAIMILAGL